MGILATLSFIDFRIIDVLDILIVAILLFEMYKLTKGTAAVKLFWLIAFFYVASKVVAYFHFTLLSELIGELINVVISSATSLPNRPRTTCIWRRWKPCARPVRRWPRPRPAH